MSRSIASVRVSGSGFITASTVAPSPTGLRAKVGASSSIWWTRSWLAVSITPAKRGPISRCTSVRAAPADRVVRVVSEERPPRIVRFSGRPGSAETETGIGGDRLEIFSSSVCASSFRCLRYMRHDQTPGRIECRRPVAQLRRRSASSRSGLPDRRSVLREAVCPETGAREGAAQLARSRPRLLLGREMIATVVSSRMSPRDRRSIPRERARSPCATARSSRPTASCERARVRRTPALRPSIPSVLVHRQTSLPVGRPPEEFVPELLDLVARCRACSMKESIPVPAGFGGAARCGRTIGHVATCWADPNRRARPCGRATGSAPSPRR